MDQRLQDYENGVFRTETFKDTAKKYYKKENKQMDMCVKEFIKFLELNNIQVCENPVYMENIFHEYMEKITEEDQVKFSELLVCFEGFLMEETFRERGFRTEGKEWKRIN